MSFTAKLLINKARIKKDGTYPIILRITYHRKIVKIPLGHCITEKDWNEKNNKYKTLQRFQATPLDSIHF